MNSGARCPTLLPTNGDGEPSDAGPLVAVGVGVELPLTLPVDVETGTDGDGEPSDAGVLVAVGVGVELPLALSVGVEDDTGGGSVYPPHDAAAININTSTAGHKRALARIVVLERNSGFME